MRTLMLVMVMIVGFCTPQARADIHFNTFDGPPVSPEDPSTYGVSDLYVDTDGDEWFSGLAYCELDQGSLYQIWVSGSTTQDWACALGGSTLDSWLAPGIIPWGDANSLSTLPGFSGDFRNATINMSYVAELVDGEIPSWNGIAMRLLFTPNASGKLAISTRIRDETGSTCEPTYTVTVTNGRTDWPQPIPGDLTFDGFADESDLDVLKEHWGADPIILGDLGSGDASYDGAVTSADLDIIRANWAGGPPASAVPEPGVLVLVALMLAFAGLGLRK